MKTEQTLFVVVVLCGFTFHLSGAEILTTSSGIKPNPDDFLTVAEELLGTEIFNHVERRVRKVTVHGARVILDMRDSSNRVTRALTAGDADDETFPGGPIPLDVKELEVAAQSVVVRGQVRLPGANIRIYAHDLIFEDDEDPAQFVTTPVGVSERAPTETVSPADFLKDHPDLLQEWASKEQLLRVVYMRSYDYNNVVRRMGYLFREPARRTTLEERFHQLRKEGSVALDDVFTGGEIKSEMLPYFAAFLNANPFQGGMIFRPRPAGEPEGEALGRAAFPTDIHLPGAHKRIYPMVFWPKEIQVGPNGMMGEKGGDISLIIETIREEGPAPAEPPTRFVLKGGSGQPGGQSGPGSDGPDFSKISSPIGFVPRLSDPEPRRPLFTYKGAPVIWPSLYANERINGQFADNIFSLRGLPGIPSGTPGAGGAGGTLHVSQGRRLPRDWSDWIDVSPGVPGKPAEATIGGAPVGIPKFYEPRFLSEGEQPPSGERVFFFPGIPNPNFSEEKLREHEAAKRAADIKNAEIEKKRQAYIDRGEEPPNFPTVIVSVPPERFLIPPQRFYLVLMETPVGKTTAAPTAPPATADDYGKAIPHSTSESWLRSESMIHAIEWARENYLYGETEEATRTCLIYLGRLEQSGVGNDPVVRGLASDLIGMTRNLAANRDYFGKPKGWAPGLSLEAELAGYKSAIDQAVKTYYLAALMEAAWNHEADVESRRAEMLRAFTKQQNQSRATVEQLRPLLAELEEEERDLDSDIKRTLAFVKRAEEQLVRESKRNEAIRHHLMMGLTAVEQYTELMAGCSADAFSEMSVSVLGTEVSGAGSMVGYGLEIVNSATGAAAATLEYDLKNRPTVPEETVADYFESLIEEDMVADAREELQDLQPTDYYRSQPFRDDIEELCPVLSTATKRSVQKHIEAVLGDTEEGRRLAEVMFGKSNPHAPLDNFAVNGAREAIRLFSESLAAKLENPGGRIVKTDFAEAFELMTYQITLKGMLEAKISHTRQILLANEARLKESTAAVEMLHNYRPISGMESQVPDEVVHSVRRMKRRAADRLLYQKYCLLQAYHFRLLRECVTTNPATRQKTVVDASRLEVCKTTDSLLRAAFAKNDSKGVRLRQSLGANWSDYLQGDKPFPVSGKSLDELLTLLKELHYQDLYNIAWAIKEGLPQTPPSADPRRMVLTGPELTTLNEQGELTIDLGNRPGVVLPREVNARLVAIRFVEPGEENDAPEFGPRKVLDPKRFDPALSANVRISCYVDDECELRKAGKEYYFTYPDDNRGRNSDASFTYSPGGIAIHRSERLGSDDSLLMDVLDITDESERGREKIRIRTYKGARTKLTIIKDLPEGVEIPITKLILWIDVAAELATRR